MQVCCLQEDKKTLTGRSGYMASDGEATSSTWPSSHRVHFLCHLARFQAVLQPTWRCVKGIHFSPYPWHSCKHYIYGENSQ